MRGQIRRSGPFVLILGLLASLLIPTQSVALSNFKVAPSTVWGYTYAGKATGFTQTRPPKVAHLEQKSKFVVNYKNFPEWAKKDFQAAVDIWSANFASNVPITIEA
jgi:hypothetical protein